LQNRCAPTLKIKALEEELCAIPLEYHATCLHSKLAIGMSKDIATASLFFKVSTPLSTMGASRLKFLDILDFISNKNQQLQKQFK
jgi:hypothetical protein